MWVRRVLAVAAVAALLYLLWLIWDHGAVTRWLREARPLPFFAAMALLPAIGAPLTPLFVFAGASFGITLGLLGTLIALAVNLALCYWIARSRLLPGLESLLRRFNYTLPDFGEPGKSALRFTLVMKLTPGLPGFVKNYGLGVAGVPFPLYFGLSMVITGLYAVALIVLGESLFAHDVDRTVLAGVAVVVLTFIVWRWSRRRIRANRMREAQAT